MFHLGALIGIPYSYRNPREVVDTNVMGTLNILEAVRQHEVQRIVHTSTSEVYGTARMERIHEGHPLHGQSPYSASKIGADKLVESYVRSFGVNAVTIRPFNTYGPRQSRRALIPTIVSQALQGSTIKMGSLDTVRDFTYVTDTVAGQTQLFFSAATQTMPHVDGGRLRLLGVTEATRWSRQPAIPTVGESVPGYEMAVWYGAFGPKGMDASLQRRLNTDLNRIIEMPAVKDRLAGMGVEMAPESTDAFARRMVADAEKWGALIRRLGIEAS